MPGREVVRQAVAQAPVASGAPVSKGQMIAQRVKAQRSLIVEALPTGIDVDRFVRIALTCFRTNEKLQDCDIDSVIGAVMQAAQLGLEPGNGRGLSWLVPYGLECQFQIGYKGYIDLFMRSPLFRSIEVREVRENDHFEYAYGLEDRLVHEPARGGVDRGRVTEYYGIARFASGGYYWVVVDLPEIERHRNRSKAKNNGPWVTDYQAMCAKTVIRIMHPYLPMSPEVAAAVAADGSIPARDEQGKVILDAHMAERAGAIGDVDYAPELPAARQSPPVTPPAAGERGPTSDGSQVGEPPASAPQPADDRAN
jgi:recombination protein RecT